MGEWERKCYILGFENFLSESHASTLCYTRGAQVFKDQIRWTNLKQGKEILRRSFDFHLTISQKHRMAEVGKDLQRSAGPGSAQAETSRAKTMKQYFV